MISMAHTPLYWLQYVIISKNLQLFVAEPCQNATQQPKVPISFSSMALILYMNTLTTIITETKKEAIWADTGITNLCHCMAMSEIENTVFWWALQQLCNLHLGAFNTVFSAAIRSNKSCDAKKSCCIERNKLTGGKKSSTCYTMLCCLGTIPNCPSGLFKGCTRVFQSIRVYII